MKLDLSPILGGESRELPFDYPLTIDESFPGLTFPNPARVLGTVTDKAGYIALNAQVTLTYEALCDRCLSAIEPTLAFTFTRPVAAAGSLQNEDDDEYLIYKDRMLDLDEALFEEICLRMPNKHLCREDCKGLCQKCGKNLNEGPCSCDKKEIDPRMAQFAKLLSKKAITKAWRKADLRRLSISLKR